ncbi:ABC-type bacteriocin/lantibiotic exporter with double-glycine peptidase domain [Hymenobacter sp. UYAg731]
MPTDPVTAIERVTKLFERERLVFMVINILSILTILAIGGKLFIENRLKTAEIALFFGSTGLITFSTSQLIKMWAESMKILKIILINGTTSVSHEDGN